MSIGIFFIWLFVGIMNLFNAKDTDYRYWRIQFWITYFVLMANLIF